jgi:GNAT superfamily N-acetyltransferase
MPENLLIRPLAKDDPERICAAFTAQGWDKPAAQYVDYLQQSREGKRAVLLAESDGDFAGYVTLVWESEYPLFKQKNIPEIVDLNVLKIYQRHGVATALMDAVEKLASERSPVVGIGVGLTSEYGPAQRMYIKRRYIPDGSGAWSHSNPLRYGDQIKVDDGLVLYLTRSLA